MLFRQPFIIFADKKDHSGKTAEESWKSMVGVQIRLSYYHMLAKQLSIFLENKSGRLTEVTEVLGEAGVNLSALSIADNSDFGILRCIVSNPEKAYKVLKEAHFAVKMTDVIGFTCANVAGALSKVLRHLSENGVFIEYMYSFADGEMANIIIRPSDLENCEKILQSCDVGLLDATELYKM